MKWKSIFQTSLAVGTLYAVANVVIAYESIMAYYHPKRELPLFVSSVSFYVITLALVFVNTFRGSESQKFLNALFTTLLAYGFGYVFLVGFVALYIGMSRL